MTKGRNVLERNEELRKEFDPIVDVPKLKGRKTAGVFVHRHFAMNRNERRHFKHMTEMEKSGYLFIPRKGNKSYNPQEK